MTMIFRYSITQSCLTLCNRMDWSPPGSFVHGISQARTLEWVAICSSRGSFGPRDWTHISHIGRQILYQRVTWEAHYFQVVTLGFGNLSFLSEALLYDLINNSSHFYLIFLYFTFRFLIHLEFIFACDMG